MPLSIKKTGGAIAEGAIDIAAQYTDTKMASSVKPFENVTDISRAVVAVVGGIAAHKMKATSKAQPVVEGMFLGSVPLFMKSAANLILSLTGSTTRFAPPNLPITSQRGQIMVRRPGQVVNGSRTSGSIPGTIY